MLQAVTLPIIILSVIGLVSGILLSLAAKFMEVEVDERVQLVRDALPGVNCGACGYVGCDEYAAAVADGSAKHDLCKPGGKKVIESITQIMGA